MAVDAIQRYRIAREQAWEWRSDLSAVKKIGLALGIACLVGLLAQVRIPLPWTPVPITGQVFGVLIAGVMLGSWWGALSLAIYAVLGIAGVPWFTGWTAGLSHVAGPTGGYIIGFILAALFLGLVTDRFEKTRSFPVLVVLMLAADFILVYVPGLLQLGLWLNSSGKGVGLGQLMTMGLTPFIAGDVVKVLAAAGAAWAISPKTPVAATKR